MVLIIENNVAAKKGKTLDFDIANCFMLVVGACYPLKPEASRTQNWVRRIFFITVNNTSALRYSKIKYLNKGKKWSPLFFEYVNGHFSVANNTRGSTYSRWKKTIIDDDDNGTVWHRLSHLSTRYEPYNEQYITHRHRVYCCINYVLVFAFFAINFWRIRYNIKIKYQYPTKWKWKQTKLGQFSNY